MWPRIDPIYWSSFEKWFGQRDETEFELETDDDSVSFYTKGLVEFGCMELEIVRSKKKPIEVFALLHDTAQYLIYSGNVIKDGDTIGGDATEKIKTRYADSEIQRDGKVIRIEY